MKTLTTVASFLNDIGLEARMVDQLGAPSFLKDVCIDHGTLQFTENALVGDLLHDAGHLAVIPARFRIQMHGNLYKSFREILKNLDHMDPEDPEAVALLNGDDLAATAWGWACGRHLDIDPQVIITPESFGHEGDHIRRMLSMNSYFGIQALQATGFCLARDLCVSGRSVFPKLNFWLAP